MTKLITAVAIASLATSGAQPVHQQRPEVTRAGTPARKTYDALNDKPTAQVLNAMQIACFGAAGIEKVCCTRFDPTGERSPHTPVHAQSDTPGSYCMPEDGVHMRPLASEEVIKILDKQASIPAHATSDRATNTVSCNAGSIGTITWNPEESTWEGACELGSLSPHVRAEVNPDGSSTTT